MSDSSKAPVEENCPYCQGTVAQSASKCQHCGEWVRTVCLRCGTLTRLNNGKCSTCQGATSSSRIPRGPILVARVLSFISFIIGAVGLAALARLAHTASMDAPVPGPVVAASVVATLQGLVLGVLYWSASRSFSVVLLSILTTLNILGSTLALLQISGPLEALQALLFSWMPLAGTVYCLRHAMRLRQRPFAPDEPRSGPGLTERLLSRLPGLPYRGAVAVLVGWFLALVLGFTLRAAFHDLSLGWLLVLTIGAGILLSLAACWEGAGQSWDLTRLGVEDAEMEP